MAEPLEPFSLQARYRVAWEGITIGRIYFTASEADGKYHLRVDTKTAGIARAFSQERRIAEAWGTLSKTHHYQPGRFFSRPQDDGSNERAVLVFDTQGNVIKRERVPDDTPNWRPAVSAAEVGSATDPVTAGLIVRQQLTAALADYHPIISTRTYDAARLAEMRVMVVNPAVPLSIMGESVMAIDTMVSRRPITGYTPKELKKYAQGDPEIHLYFSADARRIPLRATIDLRFGKLTATLDRLETP